MCTRLMGERKQEVATEIKALRVAQTKHQWSDQTPGEETISKLKAVRVVLAMIASRM